MLYWCCLVQHTMESALTFAVHCCQGAGSLGCRNFASLTNHSSLKRRQFILKHAYSAYSLDSADLWTCRWFCTYSYSVVTIVLSSPWFSTECWSYTASLQPSILFFFFRFGHLRFRCLAIPTSTSSRSQRCTQRYTSTLDGRPFHSAVFGMFCCIGEQFFARFFGWIS